MLSKSLGFHEGNKYFSPSAYVENFQTMTIYKFQMAGILKVSKVGSKLISDTGIRWLSINMTYKPFML